MGQTACPGSPHGCPGAKDDVLGAERVVQDDATFDEPAPTIACSPMEKETEDALTSDNTGEARVVIVVGKEGKYGKPEPFVPVLVQVQPTIGQKRMPCDICIVLDISKSMSAEAVIQGGESHGLTLLDIAKHGVRTIISTLGPDDRLSLVWFNHKAGLSLKLTKMDDKGKKDANTQLDALVESGATNIWLGLECGLDSLKAGKSDGRMGHILFLTDGQTKQRETVMPNLAQYKQAHEQLPGTISTFGFGYNIDSRLLIELSTFGDATYSFIPDSGFVGTVFVNTLSNLLVTCAREVFIQLEATDCEILGVRGRYHTEKTGDYTRVKLGTLQYQQNRSVVVRVKHTGSATAAIGANVTYQLETKETKESAFVEMPVTKQGQVGADKYVLPQIYRCMFIGVLTDITAIVTSLNQDNLNKAKERLKKYVEMFKEVEVTDGTFLNILQQDATGQTQEATSRIDWYNKWGVHYIPSLKFAHQTQQCNNFKDPGVQEYGGKLFSKIREEADGKFNSLDAPKPNAARATVRNSTNSAAPVMACASMASYNDPTGG